MKLSDQANAWFTPGRFAGIFALSMLVMYSDVILGGRAFVYRDFGAYGYPIAYHYRDCLLNGTLPLWNPLNNCGIPFLAQWSTLVLYPLSLFYLLPPLPWSLSCFCLGHLFLAGMGMYFLALNWTTNRLAASVAGLVYAFNGFSLNCLMWPNYMAVLGWLPWVLLTVEKAWRAGGRYLLIAAVVSATQMLGGAPELILLTWLILLVLWLNQWLHESNAHGRLLCRFLLVVGLTAGLCAAQLLPFFELLAGSQRNPEFGDTSWAMPGTGWANLLVPWFHCFANPQGVLTQPGQGVTSSYYLGIGALVLACQGAWRVRQLRVQLLSIMVVLGLLLAMGNDGFLFTGLQRLIPSIGFMRYPIKFVMFAVVLVPLLAGMGLNWLSSLEEAVWPKARRILWWCALVCGLLIAGILWFERCYPLPRDNWAETWQNGLMRMAFLVLFLLLLSTFRNPLQVRAHVLLRVLLLEIVWLDFMTHAPEQNPTVSLAAYRVPLPDLVPKPVYGAGRALVDPFADWQFLRKMLANPAQNLIVWRLGMAANLNLPENFSKTGGFYSLHLREEDQMRSLLASMTNRAALPLVDFLNATQISNPVDGTEWHVRTKAMPLATIGQQPVFASPAETLLALARPDWNPRALVYLPRELRSSVTANNQGAARIVSAHFAPQRVEIETETEGTNLLVIAQAFYHCWRAAIDGQATPIWRANHAFQAIQVLPGHHQVTLVYRDRAFIIGVIISLMTLLGCGIAWRYLGRSEPTQGMRTYKSNSMFKTP